MHGADGAGLDDGAQGDVGGRTGQSEVDFYSQGQASRGCLRPPGGADRKVLGIEVQPIRHDSAIDAAQTGPALAQTALPAGLQAAGAVVLHGWRTKAQRLKLRRG